ncbi:viral DNA ligase [Emiliania huxleyi CCMP1516]|uniref:DNA ligase (ATP) n=2 Tax=Emiliania huxleyi TaxID=2903 RepID=A0A0D3JSJ5_EMIH1|nr:viral DNA ligase [Emiliania huxleyi CCMP1516]EOD26480.1 viral DNA ligase [Emiliania huxleyi CCMP1516]|eukprot:XP_005778909.1 viral DNA ligase [Emiliania huxleyi CCMP1516]
MLLDTTALVTGANRGIGLATAGRLAELGASVVLACRDESACREAAAALSVRGLAAEPYAASFDAECPRSTSALAAACASLRVDLLVNNAAVCEPGWGRDVALRSFRTNVLAPATLTRAVLPGMLRRRRGAVLHVSSGDGELVFLSSDLAPRLAGAASERELLRLLARLSRGRDGFRFPDRPPAHGPTPAYSVSKAALNRHTRLVGDALPRDGGVWVGAACPGDVRTRMCSCERHEGVASPESAADDLARLAAGALGGGGGEAAARRLESGRQKLLVWGVICLPRERPNSSTSSDGCLCLKADMDSQPLNPNIAEIARSGRSSCKKCKLTIGDKTLRVGKQYENGDRVMTTWYHPACWPVPKKLASLAARAPSLPPSPPPPPPPLLPPPRPRCSIFPPTCSLAIISQDVENWHSLSDAHKQLLIDRAPNLPTCASPGSSTPSSSALATATLADFVTLTQRLEAEGGVGGGSSLEKQAIGQHDDRTYSLKDKSLISHLAAVLRCSEVAMAAHLENSDDVGLSAQHFYERSPVLPSPPPPPLPLAAVNDWLNKLAQPSAMTRLLLAEIVPRTAPEQLKVLVRIVRKDLRLGAGAATILKGIGGEGAWARFKAQPHELEAICQLQAGTKTASKTGGGGGGGGGKGKGKGKGVGGGMVAAGRPCKPQLAGQCNSFEVKYDGERLQVHMTRDGGVAFFSRSLKDVPATKVIGLEAALRKAFPPLSPGGPAREVVLDGEVVMMAADGTVLAFGAQGVHEQKKHKDATCCLVVFDLLALDGGALTSEPLQRRRQILEAALVPQELALSPSRWLSLQSRPRCMERYQGLAGGVSLTCPPPQEKQVRLSDCKLMRTSAGVARAFGEADAQNLEGLMIKDAAGPYVPNDRKVWLKIKKDYLGEAACDAAEVDMADSVDLVVLGAFFGTGQKASLYSSFLMGCFDEEEDAWRVVCKLSNGFSMARLEELKGALTGGDTPLLRRLDPTDELPSWYPQEAKGGSRPDAVLRAAPSDEEGCFVWEVKGAAFTEGNKSTGSAFSIRFPRLVRERDDKEVSDASTAEYIHGLISLKKGTVIDLPSLAGGSGCGGDAGGSAAAAAAAGDGEQEEEEDDDDEEVPSSPGSPISRARAAAAGAGQASKDPRPLCRFGWDCFRKNANHKAQYRHDEAPALGRAPAGGANAGEAKVAGKRKRAASDEDGSGGEGRRQRTAHDEGGEGGAADEFEVESIDEDEPADDEGAPAGEQQAGQVAAKGGGGGVGRWEVMLGKTFKPFVEAISDEIEEAWRAGEGEVEVELRGEPYVVRFRDMVQEAKGDSSRWRSVQRVM